MSIVKDVWQGKDNSFMLLLEATDKLGVKTTANLDSVTAITLELEDDLTIQVDRNQANAPINWWDPAFDEGEMMFTLGDDLVSVEEGNYPARLTLFSLDNPDGVVWTSFARNEFSISVFETEDPGAMMMMGLTDNVDNPLTDDEGNPLVA